MHNGKEKMEQSVAGRAQKKKMRSEWTLSGKGAVLRALDDPALPMPLTKTERKHWNTVWMDSLH